MLPNVRQKWHRFLIPYSYYNIQAIYNFFSGSAPRWAILAFGNDQSKRIKTKVLKKLCPTRWESRHESLYALKSRFIDVLKALTNMSLTSTNTEERNTSLSLKKINRIC